MHQACVQAGAQLTSSDTWPAASVPITASNSRNSMLHGAVVGAGREGHSTHCAEVVKVQAGVAACMDCVRLVAWVQHS